MSNLDRFIPEPRLREMDYVDVGVAPDLAHSVVRHFDFARSDLVRMLFSLRTVPSRLRGERPASASMRIDDIGAPNTGFHVFVDEPTSLLVASVGRFWEPDIRFHDVSEARFAEFMDAGFGKLAWEVRFEARGQGTRIVFELRVTATDDDAWQHFRRYFRLVGPFSRLIRRHVLDMVVEELGSPEAVELVRALPGDDRIPNAKAQVTQGITVRAAPAAIWPWLVQMGCGRGGWYSYDLLDNAGEPSARRILPELQELRVGDELAATPESSEGFVVDALDRERSLRLHGLFDLGTQQRVLPGQPRPKEFLEVSWVFVLEPLDAENTRLIARVRVDLEPDRGLAKTFRLHVLHRVMEARQLRNLRRRAEGRMPKHVDGARDVGEGLIGALGMLLDFGTPFLRGRRSHWGLSREDAERVHPGDELVPHPSWAWTHAVEIAAPAERVWPWVVQIGQDKAGFYSYQWLENLAGCDLQNADSIRPEWQLLDPGDSFRIHPSVPALRVRSIQPGHFFVVGSEMEGTAGDPSSLERPEHAIQVSWSFLVEPLGRDRCRFISRYRIAYGRDVWTRLTYGPGMVEPIGFVMDRGMLLGVKRRAERAQEASSLSLHPHGDSC